MWCLDWDFGGRVSNAKAVRVFGAAPEACLVSSALPQGEVKPGPRLSVLLSTCSNFLEASFSSSLPKKEEEAYLR